MFYRILFVQNYLGGGEIVYLSYLKYNSKSYYGQTGYIGNLAIMENRRPITTIGFIK